MIASHTIRFTLVQLGPLERTEAENVLDIVNLTQWAFNFSFHSRRYPLSASKYKFANGGWNLDEAVRAMLRTKQLPRPLLFLTSLPYSDWENRRKPDHFYFGDYALDNDPSVNVVSTYLWKSLPGNRPIQPYLLFTFAAVGLGYTAGLFIHDETRHCVFDYCDNPVDIDLAFSHKALCRECESYLNSPLRAARVALDQVAAAKRLLNRVFDRRQAFVVMPFRDDLNPVYDVVRRALTGKGWSVVRADEISRPRRITDAIVQAILVSDLVIADLTGGNPNVFYEVGVAHAAGRDVLLLTQEKDIPFDLRIERAVFYDPTPPGLKDLEERVGSLASND